MSESHNKIQQPYPRGLGTGSVPVLFSLQNVQPSLVKAAVEETKDTDSAKDPTETSAPQESVQPAAAKATTAKTSRFGNRAYNGVVTLLVAILCVLVIRNSRFFHNGTSKTIASSVSEDVAPKPFPNTPSVASPSVSGPSVSVPSVSGPTQVSQIAVPGPTPIANQIPVRTETASTGPFASTPFVLGKPSAAEPVVSMTSSSNAIPRMESPSLDLLSADAKTASALSNVNSAIPNLPTNRNRPPVESTNVASQDIPLVLNHPVPNMAGGASIPSALEANVPENAMPSSPSASQEVSHPNVSLTTGLSLSSNSKLQSGSPNQIIDTVEPNLPTSQLIAAYQAMNASSLKNTPSGVEATPVSSSGNMATTGSVPYSPIHSNTVSNSTPQTIQQPTANTAYTPMVPNQTTMMSGEAYPPLPKYQPQQSVPLGIPAYEQNAMGNPSNSNLSMIRQPAGANNNRYSGSLIQQPAAKQPYTPMYSSPPSSTVGNSLGYPPERN